MEIKAQFSEEELRAEEDASLAVDTEQSPPVKAVSENADAVLNVEQAPSIDMQEADIVDYESDDGGYAAYNEAESRPLINEPDMSTAASKEAYDNAKGFGLSFVQGAWDGAEQIGFTVAELADSAFDMEDPNYFLNYAKSIEIQPEEWNQSGQAAMQASTANALAGGAGQFLVGFVPALKALQVFKASGKVMPWMKKVVGTGVAGAVTDFAVWDYTEKRAVDYLESFGDEMLNEAVAEFKTDPDAAMPKIKQYLGEVLTSETIQNLKFDDTITGYKENGEPIYADNALQGRTKQALEGFVLGKILDPVMGALGALARLKKPVNKAYGQKDVPLKDADPKNVNTFGETVSFLKGDQVRVGRKAAEVVSDPKNGSVKLKFRDGSTKVVKETEISTPNLTKKQKADLLGKQDLTPSTKTQKAFNKAWEAGDRKTATAALRETFEPLVDSIDNITDMNKLLAHANELAETAVRSSRGWKIAAETAQGQNKKANQHIGTALAKTKQLDSSILAINLVDVSMAKRMKEAGRLRTLALNGKGKGMTREQYKEIVANAYAMSQYAKSINGEVGRALNIQKFTKANGQMDTDKMFTEIEKMGWNNLDDHARRASQIDVNNSKMLDSMGERNWMKAWTEGFINSVLSPTSLGINMTSNAIMMIARTADIHMAAFKGGGGITHKQAFAHTLGYLQAIPEAFRLMYKSYKADHAMFSNNKKWVNEFQPKAAITSDNLGFQGAKGAEVTGMKKSMNVTIDTIGKIFRGVPGGVRSMMATDEFFKVLNHRAYSMKMAVESVEQSGASVMKNPQGYAKGVMDRFNSIQNSSKSKAQQGGFGSKAADNLKRHTEAMEEAHLATFTNDWGPNSEKVYKTLRSQPWTSLILPFVRQPVNNMLYLAKSTPGLNLMSKRMSKELAAGGARAQIAQAHLNVASMVWAYAFMTAFNEGGKIMGNPKGAQGSRTEASDLGIDPNTFKNDDGDYVNYRGGEPIAGRWAIAAGLMHQWMKIMNEAGPNMTDEEIEQASWDMVLQGGLTVMDNFKDQSSLRGLENTLKMFEGGTHSSFKKRTEMMLVGWIPNLSGQIKYIREYFLDEDQVRYSAEGISEEFQKRLGGGEIVQLNAFGDAMPGAHPQMLGEVLGNDSKYNPANYLPTNIRKTKGFEEPWQKEIIRVRENLPGETVLGQVPKSIKNIKIDNRERHNLLKFVKHLKLGGKTLGQAMTKAMKSPRYKRSPDKRKAQQLGQIYQAYMKVAQTALLSDAASYFKNPVKHRQTSQWKKLGLVDYGRSKSLAAINAREKAKDTNRLLNSTDERRLNVDAIENKVDGGYSSARNKLDKLFN